MALIEKINADLIAAMKAKDAVALRGLRLIKSALLLLNTEGKPVTEEAEMQALQKMAKQRRESIEIYETQNRSDLAAIEKEELVVIEGYLPKQMEPEALLEFLKGLIEREGVTSAREMGKIMPKAIAELGGAADGKSISAALKTLLG